MSLFVHLTWLQIMQRIYFQCSTSPNKLSGQRKDESGQSSMHSADLEESYVKGYYLFIIHKKKTIKLWNHSFTRLMAGTRQFVLMECWKSWTTWSLVNVRIHSPTWILPGKMSLRQESSLWNPWRMAMTMIRQQFSAKENSKLKLWKKTSW